MYKETICIKLNTREAELNTCLLKNCGHTSRCERAGDDKLMKKTEKKSFISPTTRRPVPCPTHLRILVVVLCMQHDRCHLSGSPLTSNVSPNSRVVVVRSTRGPLAAVGVGAGPSVIVVGVVVVVLVVPVVVLFPVVWSSPMVWS